MAWFMILLAWNEERRMRKAREAAGKEQLCRKWLGKEGRELSHVLPL